MAEESKSSDAFTLPEGRLINHALFVKDAYKGERGEPGKPKYKIEIAFPKSDEDSFDALEERLCDFADEEWGEGAGDDEDLVIPILDGDKMARKREKRGKEGDAYKGMWVIRADTGFNKDGIDGPGGIQVFDEEAEEVPIARQGEVYRGCYGIAGVTIGAYESNDGNNALKFYLVAFQKTKDGEKLVSAADRSSLFKPTGRKARRGEDGEESGGDDGRRRRRRRNRD